VNPEPRQRDDYSPRQIEAARRVLVDLGHPQRVGGHGRRIAPQSSRHQFRRCHCHRHSLGRDVVALIALGHVIVNVGLQNQMITLRRRRRQTLTG
jgi:hypothetical protein